MPSYSKRISWKLKNAYLKSIILKNRFSSYSYPYKNNILVFGSGRSGTTWLSEILVKSVDHSVLINEPLKNAKSKEIDRLGFTGWGQYIPENDQEWKEAHYLFQKLFSGRWFNPNHLHPINSLQEIPLAKWWVHKFIRGNLLMPWIINNFSVVKPIYIIRNPFAVVNSQLQHAGWGLAKNPDFPNGVQIPPFKYFNQFYQKYEEKFLKIRRIEELLALRWCMENEYILSHPYHNQKWITIMYESLLRDPKAEITRISQALAIPFRQNEMKELRRPSKSAFDKDIPSDQSLQSSKWKQQLSPIQKEYIEKILDESDFKEIYSSKEVF
ncbi:MAG: sulfotransferase domain-containing protein [Bacteroidota bacterium]